jgi:hypothetical protein
LAATGALLILSASARAGVVAHGQTAGGEPFRLTDPNAPQFQGQTLKTVTLPIDVTTTGEDGQPRFVRGTFTHKVVRETSGGRLAFHYQVDGTDTNEIVDFDGFLVRSFGGFAADVFSDQSGITDAGVSRSADGDDIDFVGAEEPFDGYFIVRTDADDYEEGGTARIWARFQTGVAAADQDQFQSFETFQPAADGPGPVPIPLPAALWAGLATMGTLGTVKALGRRRH